MSARFQTLDGAAWAAALPKARARRRQRRQALTERVKKLFQKKY